MSAANVCERLRAADLYGAPKLKKKALIVVQRHRQAILDSKVRKIYYPIHFIMPLFLQE